MSMKRVLLPSAVAIALLALVFGCTFGVTIEQRLDQFISDLNLADRNNTVYKNLDPSLTDYNALKSATNWDIWFPDGGSTPLYELSNLVINDAGDGTATVTATIDGPLSFGSGWDIQFGLVQLGLDWYINELIFDSTPLIP